MSLFDVLLVAVPVLVVFASAASGWKEGRWGGLLAGALVGVVLAPVAFALGFAALVATVKAALFLFPVDRDGNAAPARGWRRAVRPALCVGVAAVAGLAVPVLLREAKSTAERVMMAVAGVLVPVGWAGLLYQPELRRLSERWRARKSW